MSDGVSWHDFVALERRRSCVQGKVPPPERFAVIGSPFAVKPAHMTIERPREAYDAQPFIPFVLHLADGRGIPVRSREFIASPPSGRTIGIFQPDNRMNVVDLLLVTDLEFERGEVR